MRIAVLGLGNMGGAIVKGLKESFGSDIQIHGFDINEKLALDLSIGISPPSTWLSGHVAFDAIVIAVKPQYLAESIAIFSRGAKGTGVAPLFISIVAGVSIDKLSGLLPGHSRICRAMPNTPALIGEGVSAYALSSNATSEDSTLAEQILSSLGGVHSVPEKLMDAVTGLSGSGPAYVYLFIESLIEAGVTAGLPYDLARSLAVQTVKGSAMMVEESGENPSVLKSRVMSPGGTTVAGLFELEKGALKASVIAAVTVATNRSKELGRN